MLAKFPWKNITAWIDLTAAFKNVYFLFFLFFYWPCHAARGILMPQQRIEPAPFALEAQSLSPWTTREVPQNVHFQWSLDIRWLPLFLAKLPVANIDMCYYSKILWIVLEIRVICLKNFHCLVDEEAKCPNVFGCFHGDVFSVPQHFISINQSLRDSDGLVSTGKVVWLSERQQCWSFNG